ncbi:MAG: DUF1816 domain-containing protein [Cyanobacteria bacterium P01_G01_bin.19]
MIFTRLKQTRLPWWIEIRTKIPHCIYYFGPFESLKEARFYQHGYIEDLVEEKALGITVEFKRCQPQMLTISEFDEQWEYDCAE